MSELSAEKNVETAMVTANCVKNWPVMPVMNAHGTNTAMSTSEMAMIGEATSSMAGAGRLPRAIPMPCSSLCSTASTTTMASSTTMPMASTSPRRDRLFRLNPITAITANVPMIATGTAIKRDQRRPPGLQEDEHDDRHENDRVAKGVENLAIDSSTNGVVS